MPIILKTTSAQIREKSFKNDRILPEIYFGIKKPKNIKPPLSEDPPKKIVQYQKAEKNLIEPKRVSMFRMSANRFYVDNE